MTTYRMIPYYMPTDLDEFLQKVAEREHCSKSEVLRNLIWCGIPQLLKKYENSEWKFEK